MFNRLFKSNAEKKKNEENEFIKKQKQIQKESENLKIKKIKKNKEMAIKKLENTNLTDEERRNIELQIANLNFFINEDRIKQINNRSPSMIQMRSLQSKILNKSLTENNKKNTLKKIQDLQQFFNKKDKQD